MKIEILKNKCTINYVINNPNKIFIFGDNDARFGKKGQSIIRDLPNTYGIRIKKYPKNNTFSFYTDFEFDKNKNNILNDILHIKNLLMEGHTIVLFSKGYGTGLSSMKELAPKTFDYLCESLKFHLNFDNENGRKYFKIPSNLEISTAKYINLDNNQDSILQPINNSFFIKDYLSNKLYTTYDLIRNEKKIAFTSKNFYKNGDILIFYFSNKSKYLICRTSESYYANNISIDKWSNYEGYDISYISENINSLNNNEFYQTHFQFISTLDETGKMIFKNDIFVKDLNNIFIDDFDESENNINDEILKTLQKLQSLLKINTNETIISTLENIDKKINVQKNLD